MYRWDYIFEVTKNIFQETDKYPISKSNFHLGNGNEDVIKQIPISDSLDKTFANAIQRCTSGYSDDANNVLHDLRVPILLDGHPKDHDDCIRRFANLLVKFYGGRHEKCISYRLEPSGT